MKTWAFQFSTPLGDMATAVTHEGAVVALLFAAQRDRVWFEGEMAAMGFETEWQAAPCQTVADQMAQYFRGERREFNLELAPQGTEFQRRVWLELRKIPYGTVISYRELANRIGNPKACRGVGAANGRNPIAIVVPCHRVIGADGSLTGYAGGLHLKERLLKLEKAIPSDLFDA